MNRLRRREEALIEEFAAHIRMEQLGRHAEALEGCYSAEDLTSEVACQSDGRQAASLAVEIDFMSATDPKVSVCDVNGPICEGSKIREEIISNSQNVMRHLSHGG